MARVEYLMSSTMSRDALAVAAAEEALRQPARAPLARAAVRRVLGAMQLGRLRMSADGQTVDYGRAAEGFPDVHVTVHDERFYSAVAFGGSVGAGESYMNGWWSTDDLLGVVRLFVINEDALSSIDSGWAKLAAPLYRLGRLFSRLVRYIFWQRPRVAIVEGGRARRHSQAFRRERDGHRSARLSVPGDRGPGGRWRNDRRSHLPP